MVVCSVLVSALPDGFVNGAACVESGDGSDTMTTDESSPHSGMTHSYLVRAENGCGPGSLGQDSDGTPRTGGACP